MCTCICIHLNTHSGGEPGEMVQSVNSFPCKHQDLILIPRTHLNNPVPVAHACGPRLGRQRRVDSRDLPQVSQPGLTHKLRANERPSVNKGGGQILGNCTLSCPLVSIHVQTQAPYTHPDIHPGLGSVCLSRCCVCVKTGEVSQGLLALVTIRT